jgi:hypothetical protein
MWKGCIQDGLITCAPCATCCRIIALKTFYILTKVDLKKRVHPVRRAPRDRNLRDKWVSQENASLIMAHRVAVLLMLLRSAP